jgi:hypothetical protein
MLNHRNNTYISFLALGLVVCGSLMAAESDPSQLGKTLTPVGAEKAGNAAGTIPAWDGGLSKAPAGFKPGGYYADPYSSDKPLFTITPANLDQYKANLTPGQIALFKKYPDYKLIVYPTHRSAASPQAHYDETIANATTGRAKLATGGNGVIGTSGGVAFPIPQNGTQAIWDVVTRYRGETYATNNEQAAVTRDGSYTPVRFQYKISQQYGSLSRKPEQRAKNLIVYFLQTIVAPARLAGQVLLVHDTLDQIDEPRRAWTYNPGQRRVRLAPNVAYDNPGTAADGLRTNDDFGLFNGATDRYDWKLMGKKEIYVPYNSYKVSSNAIPLASLLKPGHINQDVARYELHRVWVLDATLKPGVSHLYARRTFYIDEDSWAPLLTDKYDGRGELFRTGELHTIELYDVPFLFNTVEVHSDLQSGRYVALGLYNDDSKVYEPANLTDADFTPQSLRDTGVR